MKVLIYSNAHTHDTIHSNKEILNIIKSKFSNEVYKYFATNIKNSLLLPNLTICAIIGNFEYNIHGKYIILKADSGDICIMEKYEGWERISDDNKLSILKHIFVYYRGDYNT